MLFFRKNVLALTGLFLCLFLLVHFAANFILLLPESMARSMYNSYSTALRNNPLIKLISLVLLASIFFHVLYAWVVTRRNRAAKPQPYDERVRNMTAQMEREGFGYCSLTRACEVECPEGISIRNIAEMNARRWWSKLF